jgi:hypothetical protein
VARKDEGVERQSGSRKGLYIERSRLIAAKRSDFQESGRGERKRKEKMRVSVLNDLSHASRSPEIPQFSSSLQTRYQGERRVTCVYSREVVSFGGMNEQ